MKKKIFFILTVLGLLFSAYYYWQNRYVKLHPVVVNEDVGVVLFSETFHNQLFKFAAPDEVPKHYYKNIKFVLDRSGQEYIMKNEEIYIKYKYLNDMELIWNYTTRTTNPTWFNLKREMDSINGDIEKQKELDSIIKKLSH